VRREDRRVALRREQLRGLFRRGQGWRDVSLPDFVSAFAGPEWPPVLEGWLARTDDALLRSYRERSWRAVAPAAAAPSAPPEIDYVARVGRRPPLRVALKEDEIARRW
jgi:hypothetical protein